jgi:hypothetical protein
MDVTVEEDKTIVRPRAHKKMVLQIIRKYGNSGRVSIFEYFLTAKLFAMLNLRFHGLSK